jgi:RNA polymerase sigma-70 factor (ECF subfamily)
VSDSTSEVASLLKAWRNGDPAAPTKLMPLVYDELRRIARRYMARERTGHTLQTTALVNEAYLKLARHQAVQLKDRVHFFALAAQAMRLLLVDHARRRGRVKRGGAQGCLSIDEEAAASSDKGVDVLALHDALDRLAAIDPRKSQLVELRYFGGLNVEEIAEALGIAPITVKREWAKAKAWLYDQLQSGNGG